MLELSTLKAGSTFRYAGTCSLPVGAWTATCKIRVGSDLYPIIVTLGTAVAGQTPLSLYAPPNITKTWREGFHELDIRYADDTGEVVHSSTMLLPVVRAITV